jgi:hypothetical protein
MALSDAATVVVVEARLDVSLARYAVPDEKVDISPPGAHIDAESEEPSKPELTGAEN